MRRWRMTFKEAKAEMEKMFPNGVWRLQYSHWLFKSGPKTTCDVYLERTGGATHECDTWQDAIDWVYKKLGQNAAKVQDDPIQRRRPIYRAPRTMMTRYHPTVSVRRR
jgi:hypothetical protein